MLKIREEIGCRVRWVSRTPSTRKRGNAYPCLVPNKVSDSGFQGIPTADVESSMHGESPPPPPRDCFGRDDIIESIVSLAEDLGSIALVGVGGIGKTSIALTVLHHGRIEKRFGENRRFIRCDKFTASRANFLSRLSKVIGAGIENPEELTPLRPFLSSKEMFIALDNAESILDPQGHDGREIYRLVEELAQFTNICLVITSRITTIPPNCETFDIPTLSMEAARHTFYRIYKHGRRSDSVDEILKLLDFHPLSITLLATVAHQNKWDGNRLAREWENRHTGVLRTEHDESLGAAIELSLSSPTFKQLGHDARELLGVIAFFPQGLNEDNLDWLFPTIPDMATILDKFCILSLTYRSDGFVTMLVPLRDYLSPKDPLSSPLLCATKESYFTRLSDNSNPLAPGPKETQWIRSEDANVEHLLNVLTSVSPNSDGVWRACANFMNLLYWCKQRKTVLEPKIEQLPDDHPCKSDCLVWLAWLFDSVGDHAEAKRLLSHALKFERGKGNDDRVAFILNELSSASRLLGLCEEGVHQAKGALEIYERVGDKERQAYSLVGLAWLFYDDDRLSDAEEAASRAIQLLFGKDQEYLVCRSLRVLGCVHRSRSNSGEAIVRFKTALDIASRFSWNGQLFWVHYELAELFRDEDKFEDAHVHIEQAKSHAIYYPYRLGRAAELQARVYHRQRRLEAATSGTLHALEIFEKLGALRDLERCRTLLGLIEQATENWDTLLVSFLE